MVRSPHSALRLLLLVGLVIGGVVTATVSAAAAAELGGRTDRCGTAAGAASVTGTAGADLSVETSVAPNGSYGELTDPAALRSARANGTLSTAGAGVVRTYAEAVIAYRDLAVHRVTLNGSAADLADRLVAGNRSRPTERFRSLVSNGTVRFGYTGPTACPPELALNATVERGAMRVVPDPANDTVTFVFDTDRLLFHPLNGGEPTTDTRVHGHHRMVLGLPDSGGLVGETLEVTASFEVESATAELSSRFDGLVRVDAAAGQQLRGRTTLAPGSELTVVLVPIVGADERLRGRATVNESRRFSTEVDLNGMSRGAIYTVSYPSITDRSADSAGSAFVAVGNVSGAVISARNQTTTGEIFYGPTLTTTHGGFVTVRSADGELIGVSEYREPGSAVAQIELSPALRSNQRVTVTAYRDVNGNREFDSHDRPYRVNGSTVSDTAAVRVERSSPGMTDSDTVAPTINDTPVVVDPVPTPPTGTRTVRTSSPGQRGLGLLAGVLALLSAVVLARLHES